ncbi:MAG: hypothetical protein P4L36_01870 [Holophaga sp.]|nr:hypothetical protein [Holophaga sp.]
MRSPYCLYPPRSRNGLLPGIASASLPVAALVLTLACGGGGGGSNTPAQGVSLALVSPARIQASVPEGSQIPDQTIEVQASGNLNSLAGQTIYVEVVDPNNLFVHTNLAVRQGAPGIFYATLPGQPLTSIHEYTGNIQIVVSTSSSFATQLGNSPLSVSYDVTVTPSQTITGSSLITHLPLVSGTINPAAAVPNKLPLINAIQADGTKLTGSYNQVTGDYTIPFAPVGFFWLQANDSFIWTNSSSVDLGWKRGGRNVALDTLASTITFNATTMESWISGDYLLAYDYNSHFSLSWSNVPDGSQSASTDFSWLGSPLIDTTQGDVPQVTQYVTSLGGTNNTEHTSTPTMGGAITGVTLTDGSTQTLPVAVSALTPNDPVTVNFKRSHFAAYRTDYNTHASLSSGPFIEFDSIPGALAYGDSGPWLEGLYWEDSDSTKISDPAVQALSTTPLATGFERIYYAGESHHMSLMAPGATTAYTRTVKGLRTYTLTPTTTDSATAIDVMVSPVINPTINGNSLFTPQQGVGLTPTLSWTAPARGVPTAYLVTPFQLSNVGGITYSNQLAARLFLPGTMTSVTLPADILQAGNAYYFLITAFKDDNFHPMTAPWANHMFPYGMSESVSCVVTP